MVAVTFNDTLGVKFDSGTTPLGKGTVVSSVEPDSLAAQKGIPKGALVVKINEFCVEGMTCDETLTIYSRTRSPKTICFYVAHVTTSV